jgi:predicted secreted protein
MDLAGSIVVYVILWWLTLFMVLPFGIKREADEPEVKGQAYGAPKRPRLILKFAVTTVIASILWVGVYFVVDAGLISFREMSRGG